MSAIQESEESKQWVTVFDTATDMAGEYFIRTAMVQFPILGLPVVKQVFSFIIKNVLSRIDKEGELLIKFHFIDKDGDERNSAYKDSIKELEEVQRSTEDENARKLALEKARSRMRDLIRFPVK